MSLYLYPPVTFHRSSLGFYLFFGFSIWTEVRWSFSALVKSLRFTGFYVDTAAITTGHMVTRSHSLSSEQIHVRQTKLTNTHSLALFSQWRTSYFIDISSEVVTQPHIPLAKLVFMSIFNTYLRPGLLKMMPRLPAAVKWFHSYKQIIMFNRLRYNWEQLLLTSRGGYSSDEEA